jgi:hypothetical protein
MEDLIEQAEGELYLIRYMNEEGSFLSPSSLCLASHSFSSFCFSCFFSFFSRTHSLVER